MQLGRDVLVEGRALAPWDGRMDMVAEDGDGGDTRVDYLLLSLAIPDVCAPQPPFLPPCIPEHESSK